MKQFDFIDLAAQGGFELIETTSERSGYPLELKKAIIGFDSMEEAREYAEQHDLSIEIFHKRDAGIFGIGQAIGRTTHLLVQQRIMETTIICLQPTMLLIIMRTK